MRLDHLLSMENVRQVERHWLVFDRRDTKEKLLFNFQGPKMRSVGHINAEGPPVPIPNTEVKLCSAESTTPETAWEGRSWPTPHFPDTHPYGGVAQLVRARA